MATLLLPASVSKLLPLPLLLSLPHQTSSSHPNASLSQFQLTTMLHHRARETPSQCNHARAETRLTRSRSCSPP
jgi:hypothetical protein